MKEHEQYLLDVIQGKRPFANLDPKPGEGKYFYLAPDQKYDWFTPARPDQKTFVPSKDSPNPYLQPRQQAQQSQQQPPFQGYASASGTIPNAAARMHSSALDNKQYDKDNNCSIPNIIEEFKKLKYMTKIPHQISTGNKHFDKKIAQRVANVATTFIQNPQLKAITRTAEKAYPYVEDVSANIARAIAAYNESCNK